ncbi:MAG: hypothetical protein EOO70_02265 [Myxococcaceae bacterium]|nr:MAG: hypothetical protein EOO70_02265 [Myxococcaceae bacterium]
MSDEAAQLRADLKAGLWQRLLDPLLPLVLLDNPGEWWRRAAYECELALLEAVGQAMTPGARVAAVEAWREAVTSTSPPAGWARVLQSVAQGEPHALAMAADSVLVNERPVMSVIGAERMLVAQLLEQLGGAPVVASATVAMAVLDQWPAR